jgi:hypothetical protein
MIERARSSEKARGRTERLTEVPPVGSDDEEDSSSGDGSSRYDRSNGAPFHRLQNFRRNEPDASDHK